MTPPSTGTFPKTSPKKNTAPPAQVFPPHHLRQRLFPPGGGLAPPRVRKATDPGHILPPPGAGERDGGAAGPSDGERDESDDGVRHDASGSDVPGAGEGGTWRGCWGVPQEFVR